MTWLAWRTGQKPGLASYRGVIYISVIICLGIIFFAVHGQAFPVDYFYTGIFILINTSY
jgi:hypothetical protein